MTKLGRQLLRCVLPTVTVAAALRPGQPCAGSAGAAGRSPLACGHGAMPAPAPRAAFSGRLRAPRAGHKRQTTYFKLHSCLRMYGGRYSPKTLKSLMSKLHLDALTPCTQGASKRTPRTPPERQ
ncbi:MAG: hypothetical protein KA914_01350 [Ottowia sp.]|jgi:hypothetical protein|nr:hypothetical protein [Ottowia sp.]